jgi:hypothetical protein
MSNSILSPVDALRNLVAAVHEVEGYWTETLANRMQDAEQTLAPDTSGLKTYAVVHEHDYGVSTYIVKCDKTPTEKQVIRCLDLDFEPSKGEGLVIDSFVEADTVILDWQDGDDEEFDEFADDDSDDEEPVVKAEEKTDG